MIYEQLFVLPTDDTLNYLSSVLHNSSVELDLSEFKIEVITTRDSVVAHPERLYTARASSLEVFYDNNLGQSSLILSLISNDLEQRALELNAAGITREWYNYYNPHIVIIPRCPPLSERFKRFKLGAANAFINNHTDFEMTFGLEYVTTHQISAPIRYEYNTAMYEERVARKLINPSK